MAMIGLAPFSFGPSLRHELCSLDKAMNEWSSALLPAFQPSTSPTQGPSTAMDIMETPDAFTLRADAPGFDPSDINIELKEGRITISGRKDQHSTQEKEGKVVRRERTSVSFCRSFTLPDNIQQDDISASLDRGVLTVTLPKLEPAPKPQPKRIAVHTAEPRGAAAAEPNTPEGRGAAAAEAAGQQEGTKQAEA